ncbi:MAG: hypothetical protein ACJ72S_05255 [Nitrososphaeraceae archaeon]
MPRSLTASVIPFKESPDTPYILLTPDAIKESTIISATLFAKVTDTLSYAYDRPNTLIKISPCEEMLYAAEATLVVMMMIIYLPCHCHNFFHDLKSQNEEACIIIIIIRTFGGVLL